MSKFIVYVPQNEGQKSIHTVFGVGTSESAAWTDAERWSDDQSGMECDECDERTYRTVKRGNTTPGATWNGARFQADS